MFHTFQVFFSIYGFHLDVLGGFPIGLDAIGFCPFGSISSCKTGILYIYVFKIWSHISDDLRFTIYDLRFMIHGNELPIINYKS